MSSAPSLTRESLRDEILPFFPDPGQILVDQLSLYLELLLKWNAKINLTAIRDPREIVRRHFGESLFAACHLPSGCRSLLDFGSGAGFPGIPIQLAHRSLQVTLAESQNKKTAFLRELVRVLGLSTEVWAGRVESLPAARKFDAVALRAVDDTEQAVEVAWSRVARGGALMHLSGIQAGAVEGILLPGSSQSVLYVIPR